MNLLVLLKYWRVHIMERSLYALGRKALEFLTLIKGSLQAMSSHADAIACRI